MGVFENLRAGRAYDIHDAAYLKEVHGEIDRSDDLQFEINTTKPSDRKRIVDLENAWLHGQMTDGTFFTPPMHIDTASRVFLGKNVYANQIDHDGSGDNHH